MSKKKAIIKYMGKEKPRLEKAKGQHDTAQKKGSHNTDFMTSVQRKGNQ
jgi:hypothetical protein